MVETRIVLISYEGFTDVELGITEKEFKFLKDLEERFKEASTSSSMPTMEVTQSKRNVN